MVRGVKIFCTLGPSSMKQDVIERLDGLGVDMFRINLSHTRIEDLGGIISYIKKFTPKAICIDTEGAQVRIAYVEGDRIFFEEGAAVEIREENILGSASRICLNPSFAVRSLKPGDLVSIDFESVLLHVLSSSGRSVIAKVISGGYVGSNKAVTIDRLLELPVTSPKDELAIKIGRENGIKHYALSFAGDKIGVGRFRALTGDDAYIISKIESKRAVNNLDEILDASDAILIDRGDLSREEPIEKIPFLQKLIIKKANLKKVPVFVATNLLESMIRSKSPTRAEVNDIVNTILDGANGLVLAAETAIGDHPVNCVSMVCKTVNQLDRFSRGVSLNGLQGHDSFLLVEPHGGNLVNRVIEDRIEEDIVKYKRLKVNRRVLLDAEQIAIGTFSPIEGFMVKGEVDSVLRDYKLPNGVVWPMPILLQTTKDEARRIRIGEKIMLVAEEDDIEYAIMHVEDIFEYNTDKLANGMFGTADEKHPGVQMIKGGGGFSLGGRIKLIRRVASRYKHYELTPRQTRSVFEFKNWSRVVGFHTRNIIHRVHEHIQLAAMKEHKCDGIFIHPVVGPKKSGDYMEDMILASYELMYDKYYPKNKVLLAAFQSYSRYAGPREAVFTALCRKNFGCSHFVIGRDHTGMGDYYKPYDVHELFARLGDIGITPIFFKEVNYCSSCQGYVEACDHEMKDILRVSGSRAREMFKSEEMPPEWFMRREISEAVLKSIKSGRRVFVP